MIIGNVKSTLARTVGHARKADQAAFVVLVSSEITVKVREDF